MSERRGRGEDGIEREVSDPDIMMSRGEIGQPGGTVQMAGGEEEVHGGVVMVAGRALQAAELQGTEVSPATGLHQPDLLLACSLSSHLSQLTVTTLQSQHRQYLGGAAWHPVLAVRNTQISAWSGSTEQ